MRVRIWALVTALVVVAAVFACARKAAVDLPSVPPSRDTPAVAEVAAAPVVPPPALAAKARMAYQAVGGVGFAAGHVSPFNTEAYDYIEENRFRRVDADPLSTFSIDVDTASYANVRRFLGDGELPPAGAVRTEELINYFRFAYPQPSGDATRSRSRPNWRRVRGIRSIVWRSSACRGGRSTSAIRPRATWCFSSTCRGR